MSNIIIDTNNAYIYYNIDNFRKKYNAGEILQKEFDYWQTRENIADRARVAQIQALIDTLSEGNHLEEYEKILSQGKYHLEWAINNFVEAINKNINKKAIEQFNNIRSFQYEKIPNLEAKDPATQALLNNIREIIRLIEKIEMENKGQKMKGGLSKYISLSRKSKKPQFIPVGIGKELGYVVQITKILNNAIKSGIFDKGNTSSGRQKSFNSILNNIFPTELGEKVAEVLLKQALGQALAEAGIENSKFLGFETVGASKVKSNIKNYFPTGKIDVLNLKGFEIGLQIMGQNGDTVKATIDGLLNTSVKWLETSGEDNKIKSTKISFGSIRLPYVFNSFKEPKVREVGYNIITHKDNFPQELSKLRSVMAASYLNDWISGTGEKTVRAGHVDRAQLLMLNGKVYNISDLVIKIVTDKNRFGIGGGIGRNPFNVSIQTSGGYSATINNAYLDKEGDPPDTKKAKSRSDNARNIINTLVLSLQFNLNFLPQ